MKKFIWLLAGIAMLSITACGGGGGSDPLPYVGETGRADISTTSAADTFEMVNPDDFEDFFFGEIFSPIMGKRSARALFATETILDCNEEGYAEVSGSGDENSFSGTITFFDFDNCNGAVLNGSMGLSGSMNSSSETIKATFDELSINYGDGDFIETLYGSVRFYFSETKMNTQINLLSSTVDGEITHMEMIAGYEFNVELDQYGDGTATVKGKFYDSDEGYVEVLTLTPVIVTESPSYPIGGEIRFIGANGYVDAEFLYDDEIYSDGVLYELYDNDDMFVEDYFVPWNT
ncbi:MAG: hypothetical protein C0609_05475 [Deltaproteobacteria bacterium]|nr:MAG: hypothetical protein C0609_05475 [Deltaproteobacteria bacterium]